MADLGKVRVTAQWTWHGGGLAAARAYFGDQGEPWIDLSTGINPHAWPQTCTIPVDWQRLPECEALSDLEAAAAAHFDADPAHVCALPGTEIGLRLAGECFSAPAFYLTPSYRTHGEIIVGARPLTMDALHLADGATLILANPNNPDGRLLSPVQLTKLLAQRGPQGWLIVDEAFGDCDPSNCMASAVRDNRRLVVFRSFGKFFGLAGLRLGFMVGPRPMIAHLRRRIGAWPVSAAAIAVGRAAYRDHAWISATRDRLREEALALDALLHDKGLPSSGACPLFRLVEIDKAMPLFERLARQSILTRPFNDLPNRLRIGLPANATEFSRLEAALSDG
ncbi:threonine-phosphate decarboxylase [Croceicoccus estronivorus]|uniref:aminotransferase class I/II-fold pyridoxal phosphate-dependent enzyme n=1 Tax=Croceicoccus estronivorus TaxID=1172626 RepID=UPI00082E8861|nr:aminotransferase class I/II-fold pyridoxal phosphate-dependent enzyme [Croceicoccus estronivorus]OCC24184.1 threonine-phosphate decarboxylase [Croceicoccus estronivorus]